MRDLTPKQEAFCLAYLKTGNASRAYREAYSAGKMKASTVNRKAFDLLNVGKIRARIDLLRAEVAMESKLSAEQIVAELAMIAFSDIRCLFDRDGRLKPVRELDDKTAAAVESFKVSEETGPNGEVISVTTRIVLWDKNAALDRLMRHFGLYRRDNQQGNDALRRLPLDALSERIEQLVKIASALPAGAPGLAEATGIRHG